MENESRKIVAYFDGACEPRNPGGNMGVGACIFIDDKEVFKHSSFIPAHRHNSNNVAEYMAFETIIDYLIANNITTEFVHIYGDSRLVINQMDDVPNPWKMRGGFYVPIAQRCLIKVKSLNRKLLKLCWIQRERNYYADELSKGELVKHNVDFRIQPFEYR